MIEVSRYAVQPPRALAPPSLVSSSAPLFLSLRGVRFCYHFFLNHFLPLSTERALHLLGSGQLPLPAVSNLRPDWRFISCWNRFVLCLLPQVSSSSSSSSLSPAARSPSRRSAAARAAAATISTGSFSRCRSGDVDVFKLNLSPYEEYMATRFVRGKYTESNFRTALYSTMLSTTHTLVHGDWFAYRESGM